MSLTRFREEVGRGPSQQTLNSDAHSGRDPDRGPGPDSVPLSKVTSGSVLSLGYGSGPEPFVPKGRCTEEGQLISVTDGRRESTGRPRDIGPVKTFP